MPRLLIACLLPLLLLSACDEKPAAVRRDAALDKAERAILRQEYPTALNHIAKAIEVEPDQAYLHLRRGDVLFLSNRYAEALDAYARAYELNPRSAEACIGAGLALAMQAEPEAADEWYVKAQRLFNDRLNTAPDTERKSDEWIENATIHNKLHLALVSALRGKPGAALTQIELIEQAHPDWTDGDAWRDIIENNAFDKLITGRL